MSTARKRPKSPLLPVDRIVNLTDAMFAIIMTLLVLTVNVPDIPASQASDLLGEELRDLGPTFLAYVLSFAILGFNWVGHHAVYYYIKRSNIVLIWLNMAYLLLLATIPFTTDLVGEFGDQRISGVLYIGNMFVVGLLLLLQWWYASAGHRLIDPELDPYLIREESLHRIIGPIGFGIAFIVTFFSLNAAFALLFVTGIAHAFVRKMSDRTMPPGESGDPSS